MITVGSRGEIEPCIALGIALQAQGYEIVIATHPNFGGFVESHGLTFALIDFDIDAFLSSEASPTRQRNGSLRMFANAVKTTNAAIRQLGNDAWAAASSADALFYTVGGSFVIPHLVERLEIPAIGLYPYPAGTPTRDFPFVFAPVGSLGGMLNKLSHQLFELSWLMMQKPIGDWRVETLGLSADVRGAVRKFYSPRPPVLYGFSKHVLPLPDDWGDEALVTGYWFLPQSTEWQPDPELVAFIQDGPAPIYVGFGSMNIPNAADVTKIVVEALHRTGQRGLLLSGKGRLMDVDLPGIRSFAGAPFGWLFPQMRALLHHGGSGTTALGLRAGVPATAIPFMMDQPFWGRRMETLGIGSRPIPIQHLTVDKLAAAIEKMVQDPVTREKAKALSEKIRSEDGTATAIARINQILESQHRPS
ncbi:MAG: glycosyltransferase family 1 protein [Anaerolineae bacterium]|nr:glycosyltransferase family 1 protein [Anaerolineae bacterium]